MLVYIQGADSYLAKQAIDQLKAKYLAKNDGAELIEISADEPLPNSSTSLRAGFADLAAVPLFATSRLAIIKKVGLLDVGTQDGLASILGNLPPTTVAVIWDQKPLLAASALAKTLSAASKKIPAEPLKDLALRRWVQARAQELAVELEADTLQNLLSSGGGDLWFLETELKYLATAEGDQNANTHRQNVKSDDYFKPRGGKNQEPSDYFIYYRLVRGRAWAKIGRQLAVDFQTGTPFELLLGSLAAAIRKEITDRKEKARLTDLLGDVDFGAKTGLINPGDAIALLAHRLPNPAGERVHWEAMWEGLV